MFQLQSPVLDLRLIFTRKLAFYKYAHKSKFFKALSWALQEKSLAQTGFDFSCTWSRICATRTYWAAVIICCLFRHTCQSKDSSWRPIYFHSSVSMNYKMGYPMTERTYRSKYKIGLSQGCQWWWWQGWRWQRPSVLNGCLAVWWWLSLARWSISATNANAPGGSTTLPPPPHPTPTTTTPTHKQVWADDDESAIISLAGKYKHPWWCDKRTDTLECHILMKVKSS